MDKEEKKMPTIQEQLEIANKKVDARLDDIWAQAEKNLKQLEEDYKKRSERREKN